MATYEVIRFIPKPHGTITLAVLNGFIFQKQRINGKLTKFVCLRSRKNNCESVLIVRDYNEGNGSYTSFLLKHKHCHRPKDEGENDMPSNSSINTEAHQDQLIPFRLKWLIEDRKQIPRQRLREQMRRDTDIVRNRRKFKQIVGTFPDGGFKKLQLENNVAWAMVADYLKDPSDLSSACKTSPTFEGLLGEKRIVANLPKVLEILSDGDYISRSEETGLQPFVDDTFVRPNFKLPDEGNWSEWCCCHNKTIYDLAMENAANNGTHNNSHHCRSLEVKRSSFSRNSAAFFERMLTFLDMYGHLIWALRYQDWSNAGEDVKMNWLKNMVSKTLNLRSLDVQLSNWGDPNNRRENPEMPGAIPFPLLPSLVHLEVWWSQSNDSLAKILSNSPNLKSLQLIQPELEREDPIFPILATLSLERCSFTLSRSPIEIYNHFVNRDWPLKMLDLTMWQPRARVRSSRLFTRFLNRFKNTLEELEMNFHIVRDSEASLQLPHLKTLMMMELADDTIQMEDLIQLVSLRKLIVLSYYDGYTSSSDSSDSTSSSSDDEEVENDSVILESVRSLFGANGDDDDVDDSSDGDDDHEEIQKSIPSMFDFRRKVVNDKVESIQFILSELDTSNLWNCFPFLEEVEIQAVSQRGSCYDNWTYAHFVRRNGAKENRYYTDWRRKDG